MFLLKMAILPMLVKVLTKTNKPFFCSIMWVFIMFTNGMLFDLAFGASWATILVNCGIEFAAATLYFWLLYVLDGSDGLYWGVFALGFIGMLMLPYVDLNPPAKTPSMVLPSGMPTSLPDAMRSAVPGANIP